MSQASLILYTVTFSEALPEYLARNSEHDSKEQGSWPWASRKVKVKTPLLLSNSSSSTVGLPALGSYHGVDDSEKSHSSGNAFEAPLLVSVQTVLYCLSPSRAANNSSCLYQPYLENPNPQFSKDSTLSPSLGWISFSFSKTRA